MIIEYKATQPYFLENVEDQNLAARCDGTPQPELEVEHGVGGR